MRKFALVLGVVAAAAGIWFMVGSGPAGPAPAELPSVVGKDRQPGDAMPGGDAATAPVTERLEADGERVRADRGETSARQNQLVRILVARKDTGEPVPGTEVTYFEAFNAANLNPEQAAEYTRLRQDTERMTARYGTKVLADSHGLAVIPVEKTVRATGRHGELYGTLTIQWNPGVNDDREYVLELERDLTLRVRVVDSLGAPAIGVRVGISPQWGEDAEPRESLFSLLDSEAPDGLMSMPHIQAYLPNLGRGRQTPIGYLLRARIPGWTQGGEPYDGGDPPREPIVLRLPPTGQVRVHATTPTGARAPSEIVRGVYVGIPSAGEGESEPSASPRWSGVAGEDGVTVFDRVVAGRDYVAGGRIGDETAQKPFTGPVSEGQQIDVMLSSQRQGYILSGRIVDEQRVPVGNTRVRLKHVMASGRSSNNAFVTAEDGGFKTIANVGGPTESPTVVRLTVEDAAAGTASSQPTRLYTMVGERPLVPGENDLGDLVLSEAPLVVSGRVLVHGEASDPRLFDLSVEILETFASGNETRERWQSAELTMRYPGGDRFEVRGIAKAVRHRLRLTSAVHLPVDPLEFTPGAEDLVVELETGGSLQAILLVDEALPVDDLWLRLIPTDRRVPEQDPDLRFRAQPRSSDRLYSQPTSRSESPHTVRWSALWPGRYTLVVEPRGAREPVVEIPEIVIVSGANEDPRLDGIDLRGKLRVIGVQVVDGGGERIRTEAVVILDDPRPDAHLEGFAVGQGGATIVTAEPSVNLLVAAHGYRARELSGVSTDTTVILESYPEIVLRVAGGLPELSGRQSLRASATPTARQPDRRRFGYAGRYAGLDGWLRPPRTLPQFAASGEVTLPVEGDGSHSVRLRVLDDETGRSAAIQGTEPAEVEVRTGLGRQVFEIRIPAAALRSAVQEAGKR